VTIELRYVVGERAMVPGGKFVLGRSHMGIYGNFHLADDPAANDFVSIHADRPGVMFERDEVRMSGMHGGFWSAAPVLAFRVSGVALQRGDTVRITYGDKTGGGGGLRMGSMSTDSLPLPGYVDFDGSGHAFALPIQPIRVTGTKIASVHAFAPSVVRPGEVFEMSVRAEDRYVNRALPPIPAMTVLVNGQPFKEVPASNEAITVLKGIKFTEPGVYRIAVKSADGAISGVGNPILVSADARKIYWGETHGHCGFSEGIGTPDRFFQWAKEDARLDFVTLSEHDLWLDDFEWQTLIDSTKRFSEPGKFIAYPGYEWTTLNEQGGHHNILFRDAKDRQRIPSQWYPTLSSLYSGLRAHNDTKDVLIIPHAHQPGDYRQNDPEMERLVEIMSQHGTFEWFGKMYLSHGHEVGFIAASDNHLSQPGYTGATGGSLSQRGGLAAVRAWENTRDGIFDAMKSLQTYATTGDRIILDVTLNGAEMGQRTKFATDRVIEGRVIGTAPIDTITIVKNGQAVWHKDYLAVDAGNYKDEELFYVTFESPSFPMHPDDAPRGWRGWLGTLTVSGAEVAEFSATDFCNPAIHRLERDADNPSMLHFVTRSRGDASSIKLKLRNISERAKIEFKLDSALEAGTPQVYRQNQVTPAKTVELAFKDLVRGRTSVSIPIDVYDDTITLRRAIDTGPDDVSFHYKDVGNLQGDYYFVRAKLANDATAWSSPIWVGGHSSAVMSK